ncbi:MAG: Ig-like domain-containing protein, partial [Fuerstiella sp.]
PTGSVTIDNTTPAQGDTLTASNTLADADGMGTITYTWKADGSTVGTGATYVVTESEVGTVITVEASYTDGHGTNETVSSAATAAVTNVNDAPTGSVTIDNTTPAQGDTLTASNTLTDADGMGTITYTWKADGSTVGTGATYVVTESEVGTVITVEASYTDGHGTNETVTSAGTAAVTNVNDAPVFNAAVPMAIDENSASGSSVGTVSATDSDASDTLTYSIDSGTPGQPFRINGTTGQIFVNDATQLDFETIATFAITVRVTDTGGLTDLQVVNIAINDVNEAPVALNDHITGDQLETLVVPAGVLTANDFDGDGHPLSVVLAAGPASGTLTLNADGSFTYTPNGSFSGTDSFSYYVIDGSLNSAPATVQIDIATTLTGNGTTKTPNPGTKPEPPVNHVPPTDNTSTDNDTDPSDTEDHDSETTGDSTRKSALPQAVTAGAKDAELPFATFGTENPADAAIRRASAEAVVAVFLDAVPESEVSDNDPNSTTRRSDGDSETQNSTLTGFLFTPIPTTNPFLSGSVFNLSRPAYIPEAADQQQMLELETVVVGSTAVVSTTVSVGYVAWMLRGGSLLTTFLSSLPAWQSFDPLPVLDSFEKDEEDGDEESLASLVAGG